MANFQDIYVRMAEATAASRDALTGAIAPLSDTSDYNSSGLAGNVKTVVDTVTTGSWTETTISGVQFELDNLSPANSAWTQMQDLSTSDSVYTGLVTSINNHVINYVLGKVTDNAESIGGVYQSTLQGFLDIDCQWDSDPSAGAGAPTSWIELMVASGFDVVDTYVDVP